MKKLILIQLFLLLCVSLVNAQSGWGDDPGIQDTVAIECDSLIVGRSMPISLRVFNDDPLRTIYVNFIISSNNNASVKFDSIKYQGYFIDPSILDGRLLNMSDTLFGLWFSKLVGNFSPLEIGKFMDVYFTAISSGILDIDSIGYGPSNDFALFSQLPDHYVGYKPYFQGIQIPVVEGSPLPVMNINNANIYTTLGNSISTNISLTSPVNFPVELTIKEFTKYDNADTPNSTANIIENNGYQFSWSPSINDIGIWSVTLEGCDSSGACVEQKITIQVVESEDFNMGFASKEIKNFHQPEDIIWQDIDNDSYPEIITIGYNNILSSTFATYDFNYNDYTISLSSYQTGAPYRSHIALGYLNDDNILDVVYPSTSMDNFIHVVPGKNDLSFDFNNMLKTPALESDKLSAVLGEFNNDAFLDYAVRNLNTVNIYSGNGNGTFTYSSMIELNEYVRSINSADFNKNGVQDLAIGTDSGVYIYLNNGSSNFQYNDFYPQAYGTVDIDVTNKGSDFNNDKYFDFVITTPSVGGEFSEIVLYEGKPNGAFQVNPVRTIRGQVFGNCIADFNNDNSLDIAFVNGAKKYVGILYGNGNGLFENEQRFFISDIPIRSINCTDYDLDGDIDITAVGTDNNEDGSLFLFTNQLDPLAPMLTSLTLDVSNNAEAQLTSPSGKFLNSLGSSIPSGSHYLKDIDKNSVIDHQYALHSLEDGSYVVALTPTPNLPIGTPFSIKFQIEDQQFRLAQDIPMNDIGYKFIINPSGNSPINPKPGQFSEDEYPLFNWPVSTDVNFQLASDIDFKNLIVDSVISNNYILLSQSFSVTDTTAYFWRIKPTNQSNYDGIFVFNQVQRVVTDVGEDIDLLPKDFSISQNYPNPFNPTTTLKFSLPTNSNVQMEIYNINGQKIRTLTNRVYSAGEHFIDWDATDDFHNKVATGIYLMKFSTDTYTRSVKMVLMK